MSIHSFSVYCAVMAIVLLLSGCARPAAPTVLEEPTAPTVIQEAAVAAETGSAIPPENQEVQALVEEFAQLYFAGNRNAMKACLTEDFANQIDVSPYAREDIAIVEYKLPQSVIYEMLSRGSCWASVVFHESPESDSYTYLSITLAEENGEWKIESYGLEK